MPYAKSKPRAYKKRYYKKSYKPVTANTVAKIARNVVRKQNPTKELRFIQTASMHTNSLAASFVSDQPTLIAQGVAENQRLGDEVFMCGVKMKLCVTNPHSTDRNFRVMVLQDRNASGDLLDTSAWDNLFTSNSEVDYTATALVTDVTYPINSNYKVYFDKSFTLQSDGRSSINRDFWVPIMKKVKYDDLGAGTLTESGRIYVICHLSEMNTTPSTSISHCSFFARVFYKDI